MQNRREFIRRAAALTGGTIALGAIPEAVARAMAIEPAPGTTFRDAEHVVILMQENRSFDHAFGALRGVRGFRDPRAHVQPNGNRVWFQTDAEGHTYARCAGCRSVEIDVDRRIAAHLARPGRCAQRRPL